MLAPLGTAFTLEQARLIRRFVEEVVVVFDGDGAGRKATRVCLRSARGCRPSWQSGGAPDRATIRILSCVSHGAERFQCRSAACRSDGRLPDRRGGQPTARRRLRPPAPRPSGSLGPVLAKLPPAELHLRIERVAQRFEIQRSQRDQAELRRGVLDSRKAARGAAGGRPRGAAGSVAAGWRRPCPHLSHPCAEPPTYPSDSAWCSERCSTRPACSRNRKRINWPSF